MFSISPLSHFQRTTDNDRLDQYAATVQFRSFAKALKTIPMLLHQSLAKRTPQAWPHLHGQIDTA
jgi:hypothetical protein